MNRLLRALLSTLILALLAVGLAACGSDDGSSRSGASEPGTEAASGAQSATPSESPAETEGGPREVADTAYTTTDSGLQYHDFTVGDGATATAGDRVTVHYTGWLPDGTKFDSSRDRGQPFSFQLGAGQVIQGWDEGVEGMKVGGERQLIIPPDLGYGSRGAGGGTIPPDATLIFEVELLDVETP